MRKLFKQLFRKEPDYPQDFRDKKGKIFEIGGGWGNSIQWSSFGTGAQGTKVHGWKSRRPEVGDWLVSDMQSGEKGVFRFMEMDYKTDPRDMFFATVKGVDYLSILTKPKEEE
jgi:hypothetical protein